MKYVVLFRGINVGGRNKIPMAELRKHLSADFEEVSTYIQSGNVILESSLPATKVAERIDAGLGKAFTLDSDLVRVLVLDKEAYGEVIDQAPEGFGSDPDTYRYDVFFYMGVTAAQVEPHIVTHPEVDTVTVGKRASYHRRIAARASSSRVNKIVSSLSYPGLTIRNWNTTTRLAALLAE
ncbi:DUF1697 domain-containing protein [Aeromicrobium panaciterrae]